MLLIVVIFIVFSFFVGCGEYIRRIDTRYHLREKCERRMVFCYHHDSGCTASFPVRDRKDHEKNYCTFILKRDKIVEDFLPEKLLIYCAYCSVYVQVKDLQYH